ncbi:hypothetical protein GCM10022254_03600 [Actinomadura meridiana]|uniref:Translation initiation factor IF-2 n=1 Tax=Actinomadura meridiana TaxID=559626 RepID=A0ABP8BS53_9ACTN
MRRIVIVLAGLLVTGCMPSVSAEDRATDDARDNARKVGQRLDSARVWPAQDVAHRAADLDGVEVMRFSGRTTVGDGVRVVVRVAGTAVEDGWSGERVSVKRCFELRIATSIGWDDIKPSDVTCPSGSPLTFKPWPKTPDIPYERLEKALPHVPAKGRADETKIRAVVASLRLDPAIRSEFRTEGAKVGLALWVKPYLSEALDCVLARVEPGRTTVWVPSTIQRMPGEGGCTVVNALHPMAPPH